MNPTWDPGLWSAAQHRAGLLCLAVVMTALCWTAGLEDSFVRWQSRHAPAQASLALRSVSSGSTVPGQAGDPRTAHGAEAGAGAGDHLQTHEWLRLLSQLAPPRGISLESLHPAGLPESEREGSGSVVLHAKGRFAGLVEILADLAQGPDLLKIERLDVSWDASMEPEVPHAAGSAPSSFAADGLGSGLKMKMVLRGHHRSAPLGEPAEPWDASSPLLLRPATPHLDPFIGHAASGGPPDPNPTHSPQRALRGPVPPLERPLQALQLVGTLSHRGLRTALIRSESAVHAVGVGDRMGERGLRVTAIGESVVNLGSSTMRMTGQGPTGSSVGLRSNVMDLEDPS